MKGSKLIKEPPTDGLNANAGTERCFWAYTPKQLEQFQREDQDLALLHIWSDDNARPSRDEAASLKPDLRRYWINWENIVKEEGVLYQKWHFPDKEKTPLLQLLVPKVLQMEVLFHCHNSVLAAHQGITKTKNRIKQRFYWYRLGADIEFHIKHCAVCSANRNPQRRLKAVIQDYRVGAPWTI